MINNIDSLKPDGFKCVNKKKKKKTINKLPFTNKSKVDFSKIPIIIKSEEKELKHYGIDNQKWGERNGPPYPLSAEIHNAVVSGANSVKNIYKTMTDKHTESIKSSNNPKVIVKHLSLFSTQELNDKINRIQAENRIKELSQTKKQQNEGSSFFNSIENSTKKELSKKIGKKIANTIMGGGNDKDNDD